MNKKRYLPLLNSDGTWIDRPDLYVLARMGADDKQDTGVVWQIYNAMCGADESSLSLNDFEKNIEKWFIRKNIRHRVYAGHVLLEMVRISATTSRPPKVAEGVRLAASRTHEFKNSASYETHADEADKGFSKFRSTAHLQAAMVVADPSIAEVERSHTDMVRFLARARGFELFIDNSFANTRFKWDPWRVPACVPAETKFDLIRLSEAEKKLALRG
ncbi:hypothetical protein [Meridianimarinicoccus marinus]